MRNARFDVLEQKLYVCDRVLVNLVTDFDITKCNLDSLQSQLDYIVDVMNSLPLNYERLCDFLKGRNDCIRVIKIMCINHLNGIIDAANLHLNIMHLFSQYYFRTLGRLV